LAARAFQFTGMAQGKGRLFI